MLRYHMLVATADNALKRAVKRLTTSTGATADFVQKLEDHSWSKPVNLLIVDARSGLPSTATLKRLPQAARIMYIIRPEMLASQVTLLDDQRTTSLFTYDRQFDDDEFISSATKALRGDVFGLQKYFPWGVTTFTMLVKNYDEKGRAIEIMQQYAKMAGVRGPVRDRIQLVVDELMMNALYHAPTDDQGRELYRNRTLKELAQLPEVRPIQVQYGCSGTYFGISVRDGGGSLSRERALDYLKRATKETQIESKSTGAGLGLISVLRSVSKLIFNLDPGYSTEVVALFDMELFARGQVGARSLHLFTASNDPPEEMQPPPPEAPRSGPWVFAALLGAAVAALATAYYMKGGNAAKAQDAAPTLTVVTSPEEAQIHINGTEIESGEAWLVPDSAETVEIVVERTGFEDWTQRLPRTSLRDSSQIFVHLTPEK